MGWRATTPFIRQLWSAQEIGWFAPRHQVWLRQYRDRYRRVIHPDSNGARGEPDISDADYLTYGETQNCRNLRTRYLLAALEISSLGDTGTYLLNPEVTTTDGEWEAWFLADWLPGADRYPSFQALMEAEYRNALELWDASTDELDNPGRLSDRMSTIHPRQLSDSDAQNRTFVVEFAQHRTLATPSQWIIVRDRTGRVCKVWPASALNEAMRWLTHTGALAKHLENQSCGVIYQHRRAHQKQHERTIVYDFNRHENFTFDGYIIAEACQSMAQKFRDLSPSESS